MFVSCVLARGQACDKTTGRSTNVALRTLRKSCPVSARLRLKIGAQVVWSLSFFCCYARVVLCKGCVCQVILLKNLDVEKGLANGARVRVCLVLAVSLSLLFGSSICCCG